MDVFKIRGRFVYPVTHSGPADEADWEDEWSVNYWSEYTVTVKAGSLEEAIARGVLEIEKMVKNDHRTTGEDFQRVETMYVYDGTYGKIELGHIDVRGLVIKFLSLLEKEELSRLISSIKSEKEK